MANNRSVGLLCIFFHIESWQFTAKPAKLSSFGYTNDSRLFRYEPVTGINATLLTFSPGSISCSGPQSTDVPCYPNVTACLFDVEKDPCERNNIAHVFPNITALLLSKLLQYNATAIPHREVPVEEAANPQLHDGMMAPWVADHGFVPRSLFISWLVPLSPFLSLAINRSR